MIRKGTELECKKTCERFVVTGFSSTHVHFKDYDKSGGIPKSELQNDFNILMKEAKR